MLYMHTEEGGADVSPSPFSLLAFKPRQVVLAELQRNSAEVTSMAKKQPENTIQLKAQDESILIYSIALWLENKGLPKVLKRFISDTHIQDDDWKARALNLNEIFSKYLEICNDVHKDLNPKKKLEEKVALSAEKNGGANCAVSEEIVSKKKKKKMEDVPVSDTGRTPEETAMNEKVNESNVMPQVEKNCKTYGALSHGDLKSKKLKESPDERVCELTVESVDESTNKQKDKKKKKSKLTLELPAVDEKPINPMPEATKEKHKGLLSKMSNGKGDSEVIVESKDKKKKKKPKRDDLVDDDMDCDLGNNNKVLSDKNVSDIESKDHKVQGEKKIGKKEANIRVELTCPSAEALDKEKPIDGKFEKRSVEAAEDGVNESKKFSKKRKRLASDENDNQPTQEVAVEEAKRRKTKGVEPQITLRGANGHADSQTKEENFQVGHVGSQNFSAKKTGESLNGDLNNNGSEKLSHPKFARKQHKNSAEPKTVNAFQRIKIDEVEFVDERLQDNSYWAKNGAENGYGAKAQEILGQVKGRGFRHEKTKKKRGSYRGGQIDLQSHSIKFNYSDED